MPAPVSLGRSADGQTGKMRLIVVDALETTERHKHVEYYGRYAGRFTTDLLKNNRTRLEIQTSPSSRDQHGRLLAFVFCQCDNLLVNKAIIRQGYGHAYTKYPFEPARMKEFRAAEREASQNRRGLWVSPNAIGVTEEALPPPVPALGDVGRQARDDPAQRRSKDPVLVEVVVRNAIIE